MIYLRRGLDYDEIFREGTRGLWEAVFRFDFTKGRRGFYSYAVKMSIRNKSLNFRQSRSFLRNKIIGWRFICSLFSSSVYFFP